MMPRLDELVGATRDAVSRRRRERPLSDLAAEVETGGEGRPFAEALSRPGTSVIAEHKRRSPSAGTIRDGASCADIVIAYERGGAAAISILTEEAHFGGSLADLREARAATELPILRKDFTIDPYQLYEAKVAGADAVLLVVGSLEQGAMAELFAQAQELDLDALVEIHDDAELERALELDSRRHRDQQPQPGGLQRRHPAHLRSPRRRAGREGRGIGVRDPPSRADRGARAGGRGRRPRGRGRDEGGRPGGGRSSSYTFRGTDPGLTCVLPTMVVHGDRP